KELIGHEFADDEFSVVLGNADFGQAFARLAFDHLFFTGSTAVGRAVACAAAENLTPVTLELGGKSPALFDRDADFALAAPRLVAGKLLNAGQTCIAPDYALVPADRIDEFAGAITTAARQLYPSFDDNPDYTSIINGRPNPLAFYYFGADRTRRDRVLRATLAGGVTINDTLWHFAHEGLPFGGVGGSGFGAYHGERSFRTFSHEKPIFVQSRAAA